MELRKFIATTIREYLNENSKIENYINNNYIEVERYTRSGRYGEFFAPKGEGYDGYGNIHVVRYIPKNSKILVVNSSEDFLVKNNIELPLEIKNIIYKDTWKDVFDSMYNEDIDSRVNMSIHKYVEFIYRNAQLQVLKYNKGYDVIKFLYEDEVNPTQYWVLNKEILLTKGEIINKTKRL